MIGIDYGEGTLHFADDDDSSDIRRAVDRMNGVLRSSSEIKVNSAKPKILVYVRKPDVYQVGSPKPDKAHAMVYLKSKIISNG